jgi:hypothetical protein
MEMLKQRETSLLTKELPIKKTSKRRPLLRDPVTTLIDLADNLYEADGDSDGFMLSER